MKSKFIVLVALAGLFQIAFSQDKPLIIRANSKTVDIRDGDFFIKGAWTISPQIRPDIYYSSNENKKITFYTDIDSVTYVLNPGKPFNFIILWNDKDSAYTQIKYKPGFLAILKSHSQYNFSDNRPVNKFIYLPADNPELKLLRNRFNLDSIAGKGPETTKIINLLYWVHNSFRYDGSKDVPQFDGITDLVTKTIKNKGTMHCGALTWVLTDCYLAMGYKARQVVCLPEDSTDVDCHSIVTVYSEIQKKWLWMDPTNCAYVMNEKGELLSIAEVRESLVSDKPLKLNMEANLNNTPVVKESYLYQYMAKNLFAFQCFSEKDGRSISNMLMPVTYKGIYPRTALNYPKYTNNPDKFWAKPIE
jgi:hypothetical protein